MKRLATLLTALLVLAAPLAGCDLFGDDEESVPLPEGPALVASTLERPGFQFFDPETLEPMRFIEAKGSGSAPFEIASSPNREHWYAAWPTGSRINGDATQELGILNPASGRIVERNSMHGSFKGRTPLLYEPVNDHLVAFDIDYNAQFFDAETLELAHEQSIGNANSFAAAVVAPGREKVYFGASTAEGSKIRVYDPAEGSITNTIPLPDLLSFSDLALSPDERHLFATTFSALNGRGRFYMVDLESGDMVFTGQVGSFTEMAVSPNGRYVYIDCPAGGMLNHIPTQQVFRFDTQTRTLEVFIEGPNEIISPNTALIVDQITMLPGGEAFVVRNGVASSVALNEYDPALPSLIKVDAETGDVLATYTPPRDDQGYVRNPILRLGAVTVPGR